MADHGGCGDINTIKFAQYDRDVHANDGDDVGHPHPSPPVPTEATLATTAL